MSSQQSQLLAEIPHLRRYARALLHDVWAEDDLVQSSLERALSHLHQWRPQQPLRPWLLTIMHNLYVSAIRRQAAASAFFALDDGIVVAPDQEARLEALQVLAAIGRLPEDQRLAMLLVALDELSYRDAAAILEIPVGTLMSRLHRGRELLREILEIGQVRKAYVSDQSR